MKKHNKEKHRKSVLKSYYKHRLEINIRRKALYEQRRQEIKRLIGDKCIICGNKKNICFHEIYGKKHIKNGGYTYLLYIIENHNDFVCLCYWCHKIIHHIERKILDINKLEILVSLLRGLYYEKGKGKAFICW